MANWMSSLIENTVQCWGCPVFDNLFQLVSNAAGAAYERFAFVCVVLFCVLFALFVLNAVWQNMRNNIPDAFYKKSVQRVFINSVVCIGFLGMGVALPRFITTVTFEPVAQMTLMYTQTMVGVTDEFVNAKVDYVPQKMETDGFYRPELRDQMMQIMKTTITQFQGYIKLGVAIMDNAFTWKALLGVGALIKHIMMFIMGAYLAWAFFKLFFRYCCYFADVIIAMAFFAFFFPLSLALYSFHGADNVPKWVGGLGKDVGVHQFKNLINAIVTLAASVITYTVIMSIIAKFFSDGDVSSSELMGAITSGEIFEADINTENLEAMTLTGCIVLVYIVNFLTGQIPQVANMVLSAFGVSENKTNNEQLANDVMTVSKRALEVTYTVGKAAIEKLRNREDKPKDEKGGGKS